MRRQHRKDEDEDEEDSLKWKNESIKKKWKNYIELEKVLMQDSNEKNDLEIQHDDVIKMGNDDKSETAIDMQINDDVFLHSIDMEMNENPIKVDNHPMDMERKDPKEALNNNETIDMEIQDQDIDLIEMIVSDFHMEMKSEERILPIIAWEETIGPHRNTTT